MASSSAAWTSLGAPFSLHVATRKPHPRDEEIREVKLDKAKNLPTNKYSLTCVQGYAAERKAYMPGAHAAGM
jgi:hypothetical protein